MGLCRRGLGSGIDMSSKTASQIWRRTSAGSKSRGESVGLVVAWASLALLEDRVKGPSGDGEADRLRARADAVAIFLLLLLCFAGRNGRRVLNWVCGRAKSRSS